MLRRIQSTLSLQIRGNHLEHRIKQEAIILSVLRRMWRTFTALPDCTAMHATRQNLKQQQALMSPDSKGSNFILLPSLHQRLWEPEISRGRAPSLFWRKGSIGDICSGHFLTRTKSWHMSIQSLTDVRHVATSRTFIPIPSPSSNFGPVGWLTEESDPITENSILKHNPNSNEIVTSREQFILIYCRAQITR